MSNSGAPPHSIKLSTLNAASVEEFVAALGWIFEHSPWVAMRACERRPFATAEALAAAMIDEVQRASRQEQLALLRAHPDLGTRARMSESSESEQAGAGLDKLTPEEFERLSKWNAEYRANFGFPFLYAVKGSTKHDILRALELRKQNDQQAEFLEALEQVYRIARFRLSGLITE